MWYDDQIWEKRQSYQIHMSSVTIELSVWWIGSGLSSCSYSPGWLRKQQQVRGTELRGPERILRGGGERLSESAVLRAPEALQHPHPRQLRPGGHHHHQAAQVHVLLLPLLSTRGEWNLLRLSFLTGRCESTSLLTSPTAGGAGSPREPRGLHHTAVAPFLPEIHCGQRTQRACPEDPRAVLRMELPARRRFRGDAQIYKILTPSPPLGVGKCVSNRGVLVGPVALGALCVGQCGHCSTAQLALLNCSAGGFGSAVQTFHEGHSTGDWNIIFPYLLLLWPL